MSLMDIKDYTIEGEYPLYEEQQEGVRFLVSKTKAILAFQAGLGKTYTACTAMEHVLRIKQNLRGIIICPVNAIGIFERELKEKLGYEKWDIGFITSDRMEYNEDVNRVFIFSYTAFLDYYSLVEELRKRYVLVCIIDEAHKLQAKDTKTKKAMNDIKEKLAVLWLVTATPLLNDVEGMFNLVDYLDKNIFGSRTAFYNNYVDFKLKDIFIKGGGGKKRKVREITGYKNLEKLSERLSKIAIVRQKKYDLKFARVWKELKEEEKQMYEQASAGILGGGDKKDFGARMHDLQRVVDSSYYEERIECDEIGTKEEMLIETLKKITSKDIASIVYIEHHSTMDRLKRVLKEYKREIGYRKIHIITGSVGRDERREVELSLKPKDIVLITSAGSQSLNLQKASAVVFYDIPFSVGVCIQVIGRITRADTEHKKQYVFLLYTKDTIDEYKYLLFLDKAYLIKKIFSADATLPKHDLRAVDRENMNKMRDKYLWHYKDGDKKLKNAKKKNIKNRLLVRDVMGAFEEIADYYIDLHPEEEPIIDERAKKIGSLSMPYKVKSMLERDEKLMPVVRARYVEYLKTANNAKKAIEALIHNVSDKGKTVVLIDNYGVGKVIKDYILEEIL